MENYDDAMSGLGLTLQDLSLGSVETVWKSIKKKHRALALANHPDHKSGAGDHAAFLRIQQGFELFRDIFDPMYFQAFADEQSQDELIAIIERVVKTSPELRDVLVTKIGQIAPALVSIVVHGVACQELMLANEALYQDIAGPLEPKRPGGPLEENLQIAAKKLANLSHSHRDMILKRLNALSSVQYHLNDTMSFIPFTNYQLDDKVSMQLKIVLNYGPASLTSSRNHHYHVATALGNIDDSYKNLHGDVLKTAILSDFKVSLRGLSVEDKQKKINEFTEKDEFKILKQSQGFVTAFFKLDTDSITAFKQICKDELPVQPASSMAFT